KMIEAAVEFDDAAMTAYLEGNEPDEATLRRLIRLGTVTRKIVPVLCGSAFKNKGVQPLLDAVVDFLPNPLDRGAIKGIDPKGNEVDGKPSDTEPLAAIALKIMTIPSSGRSRSPASTQARCRAGWVCSTRPRSARSASAGCC